MSEINTTEQDRIRYLSLLSERYPSKQSLVTQIVSLSARLRLPKETEHFMSDIHGEYEAFCHILNNCAGVIREKVLMYLGDDLTGRQVSELCTLIYYPREKLNQIRHAGQDTAEFYRTTLEQLILLARMLSSKHTREDVRACMPEEYAFVLDELLHAVSDGDDTQQCYHENIVSTLIDIGSAGDFVRALATLIKRLAVGRLHVVGDIFDRGPRADSIMDMLIHHHSVDVQWGNHDILWMGAASGSPVCVAAVVRNCLSYSNTEVLENGYGVTLRPLALFAEKLYPDLDPLKASLEAISIMMFKLEGQVVRRNPDFGMDDRLLLDRIDRDRGVFTAEDGEWPLNGHALPTVVPGDEYSLSPEEQQVMDGLVESFRKSFRLRTHIEFLYSHGHMLLRYNENLLFHGCVPMDEDGSFRVKVFDGQPYSGRSLLRYCDVMARNAYFKGGQRALDFMWYLWAGEDSPLCGRRLKTFARFFTDEKAAWEEPRNPYYDYYNEEKVCRRILAEFEMDEDRCRIINGHTPIRVTHGESPLKAGGKLIVIDGGFCRAYQKTTGIAGYTLIANSHGMRLMSHAPFTTLEDAMTNGRDIRSQSMEFVTYKHRRLVRDTDEGKKLQERMEDLRDLLGLIDEGVIQLKH